MFEEKYYSWLWNDPILFYTIIIISVSGRFRNHWLKIQREPSSGWHVLLQKSVTDLWVCEIEQLCWNFWKYNFRLHNLNYFYFTLFTCNETIAVPFEYRRLERRTRSRFWFLQKWPQRVNPQIKKVTLGKISLKYSNQCKIYNLNKKEIFQHKCAKNEMPISKLKSINEFLMRLPMTTNRRTEVTARTIFSASILVPLSPPFGEKKEKVLIKVQ